MESTSEVSNQGAGKIEFSISNKSSMNTIKTAIASRQKSIFASKTFWFAIGSFWTAIAPSIQALIAQQRSPTAAELVQLGFLLVTTGGTIYGRYSANTEVYTPNGFPGRDQGIEIPLPE